jgi:hypothetical protein
MFVRYTLLRAPLLPALFAVAPLQAEPKASLIVDAVVSSYSQDPEEYRLPGFQLGGEAGLYDKGFTLGHNELALSTEIGGFLEGRFTGVMHQHDGGLEVELEELWLQSLGLGHGVTLKGGRFFSDIGYLNEIHPHAWDFVDAPLVYRGLLGGQYKDNGLQATWIAPTDLYLRFGAEAFAGDEFPFNYDGGGIGSWSLSVKSGGDISDSHSWQLGLSYLGGESSERLGVHGHEHGADSHDTHHDGDGHADHESDVFTEELHLPAFSGDNSIYALDLVYKWAPEGNYKERFFKLQMEYMYRREDGHIDLFHGDDIEESSSYRGRQHGAYLQGTYRFLPHWQGSLRYDWLGSSNSGADNETLEQAGLASDSDPWRLGGAIAWVPNEYTTLRFQYNHDRSLPRTDHQFFVQFIYSFGPHGAHQF